MRYLFIIWLIVFLVNAFAADVPAEALRQRSTLIREARAQWGLTAPTATFAAQIHQESRWRADAVSPVGAQGMSQVMPATAAWLAQTFKTLSRTPTGEIDAGASASAFYTGNPGWDIRALVTYDRWLWQRLAGADDCQRMAKALRAYNGGLGWIYKDQKLAAAQGLDSRINFGQLDQANAGRSASAFKENTDYPRLILLRYEPTYINAGFGQGVCT